MGGATMNRRQNPPLGRSIQAVVLACIGLGTLCSSGLAKAPSAPVTQHDILPLMLRNCTSCHGGNRREAGLDLRNRAGMMKGGKSGPALVPGNPEQSLI